ncbi:MAG: Rpn family recombination-promoting nuclease/putative transposase [Planctomycetia bacterium]
MVLPVIPTYLDIMPLPFDATLKSIVADHPGDFATLFGLPTDEPAAALNVDLSLLTAATDVAIAFGRPMKSIADINFQSSRDPMLPGRLHLYNAVLYHRHGVPVRSVLMLLRKTADADNLSGLLIYGEGRNRVEFNFEVIRLWELPVEAFLNGGLAALPLAVLCKMPEGQPLPEALREVVRAIERRLGKETSQAQAMRLLKAVSTLTLLRVPKSEMKTIFEGIETMTGMVAYDEAILEGETKGRIKGKIEGEIKARRDVLLQLGETRFGQADDAVQAELAAIQDLDRLGRLTGALLTANSWRELLATP